MAPLPEPPSPGNCVGCNAVERTIPRVGVTGTCMNRTAYHVAMIYPVYTAQMVVVVDHIVVVSVRTSTQRPVCVVVIVLQPPWPHKDIGHGAEWVVGEIVIL